MFYLSQCQFNINEIQDLIKFVSKSGVTEVEIEKKDFKKMFGMGASNSLQTVSPQPLHH